MAPTSQAQDNPLWSVSSLFGVHHPRLTSLNQGLYRSPLLGSGSTAEATDTVEQTVTFRFDDALPEVGNGAKAGIEFQWRPNDRHALMFGLGSWEHTSVTRFSGEIPTQAKLNQINGERRSRLSYTEYTVGWRWFLWRKQGFRLFTRVSVHELFDLDYREDFVFSYISGSGLAGFNRIIVTEAQTASLFMGQLAIGGEWFLRTWFSIAFEAGYLIGQSEAHLRDVRRRTDFAPVSDRVTLTYPSMALSDGTLGYLPEATTIDQLGESNLYKRVKLEFDGWQLAFRINVYY